MDLFDKESGSLYLTYDRFHNILHASREGEGTDGFLRHIHDDVSLILQEGHDPNVWFTYFEFPDKRDIPNLALKDMSLFTYKTPHAARLAPRYGGSRHRRNMARRTYRHFTFAGHPSALNTH